MVWSQSSISVSKQMCFYVLLAPKPWFDTLNLNFSPFDVFPSPNVSKIPAKHRQVFLWHIYEMITDCFLTCVCLFTADSLDLWLMDNVFSIVVLDGDVDVTSAITALKRPSGHGNLHPPCGLGLCSVPPTRTNSACFSLSQASCLWLHIAHSLLSLSPSKAPPVPSCVLSFPSFCRHFVSIYLRRWSEKWAWEKLGLL